MTIDAETLCGAFQKTAAIAPEAIALRTVGGAQALTWNEYRQRVRAIAGGLTSLGVRRGDTVALLLTNRPEFNLVDTAAMHLGATPYSIYNTLAPEQITYLLESADSRVVVTEAQYVDRIVKAGGSVEHVVVVDAPDGDPAGLAALETTEPEDFDFEATWRAVTADDILTLIYTSGTTGNPKGVELTHAGMIAQLTGLDEVAEIRFGDRSLSYLPAAHIAERLSTHYVQLVRGAEITAVADVSLLLPALLDVRPTYWAGVPRVWEKLKVALEAGLAQASGPEAEVVGRAIELGYRNISGDLSAEEQVEYAELDRLVLSRVRAKLGFDELRWGLCGAAPIATETLEFFMAIGIRALEIWGMSESGGAATINPLHAPRPGTVGTPVPGVEIKVADDGELLIRGVTVMRGYRGEPEKTAAALIGDGWLATGDIGTIDEEGYVRIVDRKKELIINAGGKNMSPANIERAAKGQAPLIGQVVAIGDLRPYNTALVALDPDAAAAYAEKCGLADASAAALAEYPAVVEAVAASIAEGNQRLSRIEQIKRFSIVPSYWEPGTEELTPTMKLKRKPIAVKYADQIDRMYAVVPGGGVYEVEPPPAER
ncbi:AMP-dependent synthetase/ligase [Nocardioides speluncae]|uniref:AMP-dependent synthetase/ligase n=1 Tax=Nocardioides speluncae TaxID=2670337 RepID=UPI000D691C3F|nr:long-chain fatty acid--CoA ligase [Nocardioides speluncae]